MRRKRPTTNEWEKRVEDTSPWRASVHDIIFEADTPAGKAFDVALLIAIVISILVVMLESVPSTPLGQVLSALMMVLGYSLIVVPTGLVTVDMIRAEQVTTEACPECTRQGHDHDAAYGKYCGAEL